MLVQNNHFIIALFMLLAVSMSNTYASDIVYPYYANPERVSTIDSGFAKIKQGLSTSEVVSIMGEPDEIHDLYEPKIKSGNKTGFTYWYLIQRIQVHGSQTDRNEKLVRVSFDLSGKVTRVDRW